MRVRHLMMIGLTGLLAAAWCMPAPGGETCGGSRHGAATATDASADRDHYLHYVGLRGTSDVGGWSTDRPVHGPRPGDAGTIMRASLMTPAVFEGVLDGPLDDVRLDLYSMVPASTADGRPLQLELLIEGNSIFARDVPTVAITLVPGHICHGSPYTLVTAHITGIGDAVEDAGFDPSAVHVYELRVAPAFGADITADIYGVSTQDTPSSLTVDPAWLHPRTPVTDVSSR